MNHVLSELLDGFPDTILIAYSEVVTHIDDNDRELRAYWERINDASA
jgi:hypothetical protein